MAFRNERAQTREPQTITSKTGTLTAKASPRRTLHIGGGERSRQWPGESSRSDFPPGTRAPNSWHVTRQKECRDEPGPLSGARPAAGARPADACARHRGAEDGHLGAQSQEAGLSLAPNSERDGGNAGEDREAREARMAGPDAPPPTEPFGPPPEDSAAGRRTPGGGVGRFDHRPPPTTLLTAPCTPRGHATGNVGQLWRLPSGSDSVSSRGTSGSAILGVRDADGHRALSAPTSASVAGGSPLTVKELRSRSGIAFYIGV